MQIYIYGLECPILKRLVYVGKTNNPRTRFLAHKQETYLSRKGRWMSWVLAQGKAPTMVIIEVCNAQTYAERELHWIKFFLHHKYTLVNSKYPGFSISEIRAENDYVQSLYMQLRYGGKQQTWQERDIALFEQVDLPRLAIREKAATMNVVLPPEPTTPQESHHA